MPTPLLPEMMLRSASLLPPIRLPLVFQRLTPCWLPAALPDRSSPIRLPAITWLPLPEMSMPSCEKFCSARPRTVLPSEPV